MAFELKATEHSPSMATQLKAIELQRLLDEPDLATMEATDEAEALV